MGIPLLLIISLNNFDYKNAILLVSIKKIRIFFFEEIKMVYINSGDENFSVQDVLESSSRIRNVYKMITVKGQSIPKHSKGSNHDL